MTGTELRTLRKNAGMTIKSLSQKMGISDAMLGFYENGKTRIPEYRLPKISEIFPDWKPVEGEGAKPGAQIILGTESMHSRYPIPLKEGPYEVRICHAIELGPETMKALQDLIETP